MDRRSIKVAVLALSIALGATSADAKQEQFWIEKIAILAVGQEVCRIPADNQSAQISVGSAMIEYAISRSEVIERAGRRAHSIIADLRKRQTGNTFCQAFQYYLEKGYPH